MRPSDDVRDALEEFCRRFSHADLVGFDAALADDPEAFVIGTQRWASGRDEWLGNFRTLVEEGLVRPDGSGVHLELAGLRGWEEGSMGWVAGWATFVFAPGRSLPARLTAVMRRDAGAWKLVHAHFSVAVPDPVALDHVHAWLDELGQGPTSS